MLTLYFISSQSIEPKGTVVSLNDYKIAKIHEEIDDIEKVYGSNKQQEHPSGAFIMIMRSSLVNPILKALHDIQPYAKTSHATVYVNEILYKIRELEDNSTNDPFLEVLSGFYIAMTFDNQWAKYEAEQYEAIRKLLKKFAKHPVLKLRDIEKAIIEMEEIGFDIPIST